MVAEFLEVRAGLREGRARFFWSSQTRLGDAEPVGVERDEGAEAAFRLGHASKHDT